MRRILHVNRNAGTSNHGPRNPVLGFGLVIIIIKGFLSLKPLGTEPSYVPKEGSWHFSQRWFCSESLLCQTCLAHGSRKWREALNTTPHSFCCPVFSTEEKDPNFSNPHTELSLKESHTYRDWGKTGNFSGRSSLQIPIIWHDIALGLLLGRCQMHEPYSEVLIHTQ